MTLNQIARAEDRRVKIIRTAMAARGIGSKRELSELVGVEPQVITSRMTRNVTERRPWSVDLLTAVADALDLDAMSRAALIGGKGRCQYE